MSLNINEQYDKIYRYCYLRVRQRETAEDITQETFLRYLEHTQYHSLNKTLEILYTIARNLCIDYFRKSNAEALPEDSPSSENIEDKVLSGFTLKQALNTLPDEDREIILMRYINDEPVSVIAAFYGKSRFAMNRRINNILKSLHNAMGKEETE